MPAISNTSPLVLLAEIERLHLLNDIYDTIWVPDIVRAELAVGGSRPERVAMILETEWIQERHVDVAALQRLQASSLHRGEAAVIALAMTSGSMMPTILDDRQARREAERRGIPTVGTGGVLVIAKHFGLITEVRPLLNDLRDAGLYMSDSVYTRLLQRANEI